MTITKYDRVAIIPKRCDKCNRLFWLEPYNIFYKTVGVDSYPLKLIECRECMKNENQITNQNWISEVGLSNATVAVIEADKSE